MTTMYSRRAGRMLSIDRKLGAQHQPHIQAGATQRHSRGWRDLQPEPQPGIDWLDAASLIAACVAGALMVGWIVILLSE